MREKTVFYTLLLLLAVILPFIYHDLDLVLRAVLMACAVLGLQLLMSYGGQISLGNAAFMGLGAYISGVLSVKFGLPSLLTIFVAVAVTALIALIVGYPLLRLKGYYLALGTLAFGLSVTSLISTLYTWTGGPAGLIGIPDIGWGDFEITNRAIYYYIAVAMFAIFFWYSSNLMKSRVGRALLTLKSSENTAEAMGIRTAKVKLQFFVLSAVFAAFSGAVMGHYLGIIVPSQFNVIISIELLIAMLLGGEAILIGSLVGSLLWFFISDFTHSVAIPRMFMLGLIMIVLILFVEHGVSQAFIKVYNRIKTGITGKSPEKRIVQGGETNDIS
ncbi:MULTISPECIES: branched-chain amino acid ABC transporter permease [Paenibacillus]|uniref:Branched-chain amino acid ABC transporter permease n=1 Tax=Paenibacillus validus TaxID=44253 RepID=A0A7X2Z7T1_9BACL|nr:MULTISPECIES: branched-chain amino acid ABC transporter permease [Paenibacillus]MUG69914.1 hypothetical protein [Paenibacillus validus]